MKSVTISAFAPNQENRFLKCGEVISLVDEIGSILDEKFGITFSLAKHHR